MAEFLLHINYGGSCSLYFGVGRKHLKCYLFRYRFMMPFISLLCRKDFDSSDVVAVNLFFGFFWSFMLWNAWYLDRDFISMFRLRLHCHVILLYFQMFGLDLWSLSELFFKLLLIFYGFDFFFFFYYRSIISLSSQQSWTLFLVLVEFQWLGICELSTHSVFWKLPFVKLRDTWRNLTSFQLY